MTPNERKLTRDTKESGLSIPNFPGNSEQVLNDTQKKKIEKVVTSETSKKKKSLGEKIKETLFGGDAKNVGEYILYDVMIPALKETIVDMIRSGTEMFFLGERRNSRSPYRRVDGNRDYNRISRRDDEPRPISRSARANHDFSEVKFTTRRDAQAVLDKLNEVLDEYDVVSVEEFYIFANVETTYMDKKWGWTNVDGTNIYPIRDGKYILTLPRPKEI